MSSPSDVFEGAIGIDLGTTYSCISVFINDVVDIIPNDQGNRTTPSRVAFHNGQILVGDAAMNLSTRGVKNVIYDAKRMIGRKFTDKEIVEDRKIWPFDIVQSTDGHDRILIRVENADGEGNEAQLTPEEVSAHVLRYLKACAERHLGKEVKNVVITVPAYFNDAQRERTRAAGAIAGLNVVRIVNEPTAAALCYGIGSNVTATSANDPAKNVLVFDFGGGTFDVSVITIDHGAFEVRSTAGHTHLGGQDVDAALVNHMLADCKKKHQKDFSENAKVLAKFRLVAEKAKKALSHATQHEVVVEGVLDGDEYALNLSRAKLEELCTPLFDQCMAIVNKALADSKLNKTEIHEVIMVGGSSRIPKMRQILADFFGRAPCCSVNPDEAIAAGAGIQASILSKMKEQKSAKTDHVILMDVVPLSIGVDVDQGKFDVLIPRNTTIPYHVRKEYSTFENNQTEVDIDIFEGERPLTKHNHKLGSFSLTGITKAKKGQVTIAVEFSVDANGILTVAAEEEGKKGVKNGLVVKNEDRLSNDDIDKMVKQAEEMRAKDAIATRVHQLVAASIQELEETCDAFDDFAADGAALPPKLQKKRDAVQAALTWFRHKGTKLGGDEGSSLSDLESRAKKAAALASKAGHKLIKFARKSGKNLNKKPSGASKRKRRGSDDDDDEDDYQSDGSDTDSDSDDGDDGDGGDRRAESGDDDDGHTKHKKGKAGSKKSSQQPQPEVEDTSSSADKKKAKKEKAPKAPKATKAPAAAATANDTSAQVVDEGAVTAADVEAPAVAESGAAAKEKKVPKEKKPKDANALPAKRKKAEKGAAEEPKAEVETEAAPVVADVAAAEEAETVAALDVPPPETESAVAADVEA